MSRRTGMVKTYELLTRHFGWDRLPRAASEREELGGRAKSRTDRARVQTALHEFERFQLGRG